VSLSIAAGECVAIVGPNGAGKSTLLAALLGALPPIEGAVLLDGLPLASLPGDVRARRLALVPQSARAELPFRVRELVALGRAAIGHDERVVSEAMARMELEPLADRRWTALSGGERQRVLMARALAQEAAVLLLDEPTAHQDPRQQLLVLEQVRAHASAGGAAVVVLHDLSLAGRLDRVVLLREGGLVADGPPALALAPHRLREVFGVEGRLEQPGPLASLRLERRA